MTTALDTRNPRKQAARLDGWRRGIRLHLLRRLTETQYRRIAKLYGFDGEAMSQRETAASEDVDRRAVFDSRNQVLSKLQKDGHLWLIWLVGKHFTLRDTYKMNAAERGDFPAAETFDVDAETEGYTRHDVYPGDNGWASDRFSSNTSQYDAEVQLLQQQYDLDLITRVEFDVGLLMALADQRQPKGSDRKRAELRQDLEWAAGAREIGAISQGEYDHRVTAALRTYVREGEQE